ncbi:MAG: efflux RND transporter periplasmic adaptor subunit [Caldithrix sp.]|nr:efflux RND transporter periplasmic adaptor subunit [Caldithrix sp.]
MNTHIKRTVMATLPILAMGLLISACKPSAQQTTEKPVAVRVMKMGKQDMRKELQYLGTVHAEREIKVLAQVQGTLQKLPFEEGQRIQTGDLIAEIFAPDIRATVNRLQADKQYWHNRYKSDQRLAAKEAIAEEQLKGSVRAFKSASAALEEAKARLAKTREHAPINGTVLEWFLEPGQHVMPGQPLLIIGDGIREIHVQVVENDIKKGINPGQKVLVDDGQHGHLRGQVSEIAPRALGISRTFDVTIRLLNRENFNLPIGASVDVNFILKETKQVPVLPARAILHQNNRNYIFAIKDSVAVKTPVKTGIRSEGMIGLSFTSMAPDYVAVSNLNHLEEGWRVYPVMVGEESK